MLDANAPMNTMRNVRCLRAERAVPASMGRPPSSSASSLSSIDGLPFMLRSCADRSLASQAARAVSAGQQRVERNELAAQRLGDRGVDDLAFQGVHAVRERRIALARAGKPVRRE